LSKVVLDPLQSTYLSNTKVNSNYDKIEAAIENTLSRDGTAPNAMGAVLDMGLHRVINVGAPVDPNDAVRLVDLTTGGSVDLNATIHSRLATELIAGSNITITPSLSGYTIASTSVGGTGDMLKANNLSDLLNAATARTNLGLGTAATQSTSAFLQPGNNLSDLSAVATARTNLGLGTMALQAATSYLALTGGTLTGKLTTVTGASGAASLTIPHGAAPTSPVDGDVWTTTLGMYVRVNGVTVGPLGQAGGAGALLATNNLSDLANASTARTNLGLGTMATQASTSYLALSGGTMTGKINTLASAAGGAGVNWPHGAAPTSPVNGDMWTTTAGVFARINGATVGPFAPSTGFLQASNNLSDVASITTSRSNLGLGSMATQNASAIAVTGGTLTGITQIKGTLPNTSTSAGIYFGDAWAGAGSDARVDSWSSLYKVLSTSSTSSTTEQTLFVGAKVQAGTPFTQKGAIYAQVQNYASDTGSDAADAVSILAQCYGQATNSANWAFTGDVILASGMEGWCFGMELGCYILGAAQSQSSLTADYQKGNLWLGASNGSSYAATFGIGFAAGYWHHGIALQGCYLDMIHMRNPQQNGCRGIVFEDHVSWGSGIFKMPSGNSIVHSDGSGGEKLLLAWTNSQITIGSSSHSIVLDLTTQGLGQRTVCVGAANSAGAGFRQLMVLN
jgi:hypothetical protein